MTRARPRRELSCPHQKARTVETCEACDSADEVERLRALLRRIEWRGADYSCPDCKRMHRDGHAPGCELDLSVNPAPIPMWSARLNDFGVPWIEAQREARLMAALKPNRGKR